MRLATMGGWCSAVETVIEAVGIEDGAIVMDVRPAARARGRCGICAKRASGYDPGGGPRRWRALDLGRTPLYLRAGAPRVCCPERGVIVARVPWARHGSAFTRGLEDSVAWLVGEMSMSAVAELLSLSWRTVGHIMGRVVSERARTLPDPLAGLRRIGIDELSYRRGQRYVVGVVNHDSGLLVWLGEGREAATVDRFFAALGPERAKAITHITSDMGPWIHKSLARHAPGDRLHRSLPRRAPGDQAMEQGAGRSGTRPVGRRSGPGTLAQGGALRRLDEPRAIVRSAAPAGWRGQ